MLDVPLPTQQIAPAVIRAFAACLASVTETPVSQVPQPDADLVSAIAQWRTWLAGRGSGLVPIANASRFNWPGYWIALLEDTPSPAEHTAVLMFGTPAGVVLSPQDPALLGRAAADLPVLDGFVAARFDPVLSPAPTAGQQHGWVVAVAVAARATEPMSIVSSAAAVPGRGLEGDRYAQLAGTFTPSSGKGRGYDLTLIEAEVLDDLVLPDGGRLGYADARRNLVTRGVDLNSLVGQRFRIGEVECLGQRLCEPCAHLERLTTKGTLRSLIHRGGLRADVLTAGEISTGSVIESIV